MNKDVVQRAIEFYYTSPTGQYDREVAALLQYFYSTLKGDASRLGCSVNEHVEKIVERFSK